MQRKSISPASRLRWSDDVEGMEDGPGCRVRRGRRASGQAGGGRGGERIEDGSLAAALRALGDGGWYEAHVHRCSAPHRRHPVWRVGGAPERVSREPKYCVREAPAAARSPSSHHEVPCVESAHQRDQPLSAAARGEPGRLVPLGDGGVREGSERGQAGLLERGLLGLSLVPRDGARELRRRRDCGPDEPPLRLGQGRSRGAPGHRRHLHGGGAGSDSARRLADERLPHT